MKANYRNILLGLVLSIGLNGLVYSQPVVLSVDPISQILDADVNSDIIVDFDRPVDPLTINSSTISVYGRWSGPAAGTWQVENGNSRARFVLDEPLFYGEWITVSLSRGVTDSMGLPLSHAFVWNFWTGTKPGRLDLIELDRITTRLAGEGLIQSYGAYAGDLNNDGWSDLAVPNEQSNDVRVFLNDGNGSYGAFTIHPVPSGSSPSTNEGADFNNDGEIDLALGNGGNSLMTVFFGDGTGALNSPISYTAGLSVRGLGVVDCDGDGYADIVTANRNSGNLSLFMNTGAGLFDTAITFDAGVTTETAISVADANNDGIPDLFVGSLFGQEVAVMLGDGNGGFTFSDKVSSGGRCWMLAVGDINLDGNVDVASANSSSNNVGIMFGDGNGNLLPAVTYPTGSFTLAVDLGDIDGDGDLDLVTSNYSGGNWTLYENDGTGNFINQRTLPSSATGSCAILHDRDNDGDLDMTGIDEIDDLLFIFENGCCRTPGDADSNDAVDIADLTYFVAFLFLGEAHPDCFEEADIDGNCSLDIGDLTYRVAFMFENGFAPVDCHVCL